MVKLFFQLLDALTEHHSLNPDLLTLLPRSYKRVGHIAIFNLQDSLIPYKIIIAQTCLTLVPPSIRTIARFVKPIDGVTRKPSIEWLCGDTNFETFHLEHHTKFIINPQELMLSAGNHNERKRLIELVTNFSDQPIVFLDMFACIGNLSLPLVNQLLQIKAIFLEINPVAIKYLRKSLDANKISADRYTLIEGDNHQTCPNNCADIVSMGYFSIDHSQLLLAIRSLNTSKQKGLILIHDACSLHAKSKVITDFQNIIDSDSNWQCTSIHQHVIKSIGPSFQHLVFDCHLSKRNT